jgi:hypothetical protein
MNVRKFGENTQHDHAPQQDFRQVSAAPAGDGSRPTDLHRCQVHQTEIGVQHSPCIEVERTRAAEPQRHDLYKA